MRNKHDRVKKPGNLLVWIALALLLAGTGVILYPHVLQWQYRAQTQREYTAFIQKMAFPATSTQPAAAPSPEAAATPAPEETRPYEELYEKMQAYNRRIVEEEQAGMRDPWAYEVSSFDLQEYGFSENVIGFVQIPRLDVLLPIYLGASEANMLKGAVHLTQTSLPLGGENCNCVIAAHRGYYGAEMFKNLVDLQEGDEVIVINLWETLRYRVSGTRIIEADDVGILRIQEGRDMLSLFTCYYREDQKDRFVVFCDREP